MVDYKLPVLVPIAESVECAKEVVFGVLSESMSLSCQAIDVELD